MGCGPQGQRRRRLPSCAERCGANSLRAFAGRTLDVTLAMAGSAQESRVRDLVDALARRGIELPGGRITIDEFGDSAELSGALLQLIRSGAKRAGASLLWSYDHDGEQVAAAGDVTIVLDYGRRPCMLTRVTRVEIVPFDRVTAEFAALEGEGDLSLAF